MIDIEKLTKFIDENYIDPDSQEGKRERLISGKSNPLVDFTRKITGRGGMNPFSGMSPVNRPDFQKVKDKIKASDEQDDFVRRLLFYINKKGKTHPQVYNAAGMTPDCFSKIVSGKTKKPKRISIISLAFALELNLEEAQDLLFHAGYYFPVPTIKEDIIFQFCFEDEKAPYTIDEVNDALCRCGFQPIGGRK